MKKTNIYLTKQLVIELDKMSKKTGIPKAEITRRALTEYLAKKNK